MASTDERVAGYRAEAAAIRAKAATAANPTIRNQLLQLAAEYDKLAEIAAGSRHQSTP